PCGDSRHDDPPGHLRSSPARWSPAGRARIAGAAGAVPAAAWPSSRIRLAGSAYLRKRNAERRSDQARRRHSHGAEIATSTSVHIRIHNHASVIAAVDLWDGQPRKRSFLARFEVRYVDAGMVFAYVNQFQTLYRGSAHL